MWPFAGLEAQLPSHIAPATCVVVHPTRTPPAPHRRRCVDIEAELVGRGAASGHLGAAARTVNVNVNVNVKGGRVGAAAQGGLLVDTAWNYQACTELTLELLTSDSFGFYPETEAQISGVLRRCVRQYGVEPRPGWMALAFGRGADFSTASNLIFMENSKDPWHVGTATIAAVGGTNGSVTRTVAQGGAHHQDLRCEDPLDAPDVKAARRYELAAMRRWLA